MKSDCVRLGRVAFGYPLMKSWSDFATSAIWKGVVVLRGDDVFCQDDAPEPSVCDASSQH